MVRVVPLPFWEDAEVYEGNPVQHRGIVKKSSDAAYPEEEAQRRFEKLVRTALDTPPKPMKDMPRSGRMFEESNAALAAADR